MDIVVRLRSLGGALCAGSSVPEPLLSGELQNESGATADLARAFAVAVFVSLQSGASRAVVSEDNGKCGSFVWLRSSVTCSDRRSTD
jgi:hypothetical protein